MSATIYYELRLLAASLAVGLCLMAAYDGLRIFRVLVPHQSLWTGMEDAVYWLASSIATFLLLFCQNDGILRWYAIGGVLLGMLLYNMTVSRILLKLLKKCEKYFTIKRTRRGAAKRLRKEQKEKRKEQKKQQKEQKEQIKRQKEQTKQEKGRQKAQQKAQKEQQKERQKSQKERKEKKTGDADDAGKRKNEKKEKRKSE